ncbi:MAG: sigma-54 dependent transcriptional regulator [Deltaproteobacteria bacterium]|jgi:DNA-binding NtrC family response regulator|nr:sigma-54 dependent transcriptional regulator [Deltaproteobacteria bacterium]
MAKILVVDDEEYMLKLFRKILAKEGHEVLSADSGVEAVALVKEEAFDLMISDLVMPDFDGMDLLKEIKTRYPDMPFIVITAYGTVESAVEAMKTGAFDYLTKPFRKDDILLVVGKALQYCQLRDEVKRLREELKERDGFKEIIGKSKVMQDVFKLVAKVADSQATVLIQGESGTGKELIARSIHNLSGRTNKPWIAVDCGVFPENLLQTELFGHVKGAFTGAVTDKKGLFIAADGGTLFLDEIGTISSAMQLNLLRVLQEKEVRPIGSVTSIKGDVRIIAATNINLEEAMHEGGFRKDLYYRLAVVTIDVPPLRERASDIPAIACHFMRKYGLIYNKNLSEITPEAMRAIMENPWPGNIRELENVMERAVLLSNGPLVDETALPLSFRYKGLGESRLLKSFKGTSKAISRQAERKAILKALKDSRGNRTRAAQALGISRSSLYNKMGQLGIGRSINFG